MLNQEVSLIPKFFSREPFGLLRQMTSELDRAFDTPPWPAFFEGGKPEAVWTPLIDVFEKDNRLITTVDLPGMKKEEVKVEVIDGTLVISGERKREYQEKKEQFYRREREYGTFYRVVPLYEGMTFEDIKATFAEGVLEVSLPLPVPVEKKARRVEIQEPPKIKTAA
jgi:HSP20 family protein